MKPHLFLFIVLQRTLRNSKFIEEKKSVTVIYYKWINAKIMYYSDIIIPCFADYSVWKRKFRFAHFGRGRDRK